MFNAQISIGGETVWRGDIDLTVDEPVLKAIAETAGDLYLLTEHETLFTHGDTRLKKRYVYWTDGPERQVGDGYWERFGWDNDALRRNDSPEQTA